MARYICRRRTHADAGIWIPLAFFLPQMVEEVIKPFLRARRWAGGEMLQGIDIVVPFYRGPLIRGIGHARRVLLRSRGIIILPHRGRSRRRSRAAREAGG